MVRVAAAEQISSSDEKTRLRDGAQQLDRGHEPCVGGHPLLRRLQVLAIDGIEGLQAGKLAIEKMHHVDAVDVLGNERVDPGQKDADSLLAPGDRLAKGDG